MATQYYIVGDLRKDYKETYLKLGNQWDKYAQRGYDIIDKVQKEGLLLVGINPSFDESFGGPCASVVRVSDNGGYRHPYFVKPKRLNEDIGIGRFSHVDMFSVRTRPWCSDYDEEWGVDMYEIGDKRVPVFYSGMLSGAHTIDNGSFDRLIWHIKYVLFMLSEKSSQLCVNS